ncbi:MAG TPA: hypothetical protein VGR61_05595 [Candidatus Dormibacteraeota bacterium]|nr:hypothetical protein [Candidatus Dormibacteraeota bacterium]
MSTEIKSLKRDFIHSRWFSLSTSIGIGAVMFGASAVGGHPGLGLAMFGIMVVFGAAVFFGGRSETIRGLRGDGRDERFAQMDLEATALAGGILILVIIAAFVFEIAHGRSGMPYAWLGAVGGVTYVGGILVIRLRG